MLNNIYIKHSKTKSIVFIIKRSVFYYNNCVNLYYSYLLNNTFFLTKYYKIYNNIKYT